MSFKKVTILFILSLLPFLAWAGTRTVSSILFDINCGGRIKRAGDANTVELAKQELKAVLQYLKENNMTKGYTSILYQTPADDVGFWYKNLRSAYDELDKLPAKTSQLEKTNVLMKLRETLLDQKQSGLKVTLPSGISIFPYNRLFCLWGWLSLILSVAGTLFFGLFVMSKDD